MQPAHAFDLRQLIRDALLQRLVPVGEIVGLGRDLVVQLLHAQHRLDARHQRRLVHRLGQIFVGAGFESGDHVLGVGLGGHQDDRHERQARVGLETPRHLDAVDLRHHHVEQDEVRAGVLCATSIASSPSAAWMRS